MTPFVRHAGIAAPMPGANIDTDVIMPKQFLKGIDRSGLARGVFHDLRFDASGAPRPDFILNRPGFEATSILVVGPNFGCGSSREHAVWGLLQLGVRAIIGTSFGGIFADNALNNGLLLVSLTAAEHQPLNELASARPTRVSVDLEAQSIIAGELRVPFAIAPTARRLLLLGLDRIGTTLERAAEIRAFERRYFDAHPWLLVAHEDR